MRIRDLMKPVKRAVSAYMSAKQAAVLMKRIRTDVMPVVDGYVLIGTVSSRDLRVERDAIGPLPGDDCRVGDVMDRCFRYCFEDESPERLLQVASDAPGSHLVVLNHDYEVLGTVDPADLAMMRQKPARRNPPAESTAVRALEQALARRRAVPAAGSPSAAM